MQCEIEHQNDF